MISKHLRKNLDLLELLQRIPKQTQKHLIAKADRSLIISICELCHNLCAGTFCCSPKYKRALKLYRKQLTQLASRKKLSKNLRVEKNIISQKGGGLDFLSYLIPPALEFIYHNLNKRYNN